MTDDGGGSAADLKRRFGEVVATHVPPSFDYVQRRIGSLGDAQKKFKTRVDDFEKKMESVSQKRKASALGALMEDVARYRDKVLSIRTIVSAVSRKVGDMSRRARVLREKVEKEAMENEVRKNDEQRRDTLLIAKTAPTAVVAGPGAPSQLPSASSDRKGSAADEQQSKVGVSPTRISRRSSKSKSKGKRKKKAREVQLQ